jgi:hypothetical protein
MKGRSDLGLPLTLRIETHCRWVSVCRRIERERERERERTGGRHAIRERET